MDSVNPKAGQVGQRRQVIIRRQPFRLEGAIWLAEAAKRSETLKIDDGSHDRILGEALGVIPVFVSGETTEHRLPKRSHEEMSGDLTALTVVVRCELEDGAASDPGGGPGAEPLPEA